MSMEINDELFFSFIKEATFQVRTKIVSPSKTTTFATTSEAGELGNSPPTTMAIGEDESDKLLVFFSSPWAFLDTKFVTTRLPSHHFYKLQKYIERALS